MSRALFLDRDGVINRDVGYAWRPEQIVFSDGIFELARAARAQGHKIIIITNQSGIGRGLYSEEDFHALMRWMGGRFAAEGAPWEAYYFCPHVPEAGCECRKPKPGMLLRARNELGIDMAASLMIGDKEIDLQAAERAGVGKRILYDGKRSLSAIAF